MKLKYGIGAVIASTLLVAGCTTDKGEIKDYNAQVQKAFDEEKTVSSVGKKLNKLEQDKQKLVKKINGKNQQKVKETSGKVVDNVEEREKEFKKEEKAIDESEKQFKKAGKHLDNINNKQKKKEVKDLDDALKAKYKAHDEYAKAYKNIMSKEKAMFEYTAGDQVEQAQIDKKSEAVSKAYKDMNKAFKKYSKAMNKVNKEKEEVDSIS
ncbi:YkyA family protein [Staphylococcus caeli]|uniref:Lipoprotein n=1 Tax=Staphylococcus caeli TaxID=2201815 RepID=A0A1D4IJR2_9STAP|nr:YkyA family protein [Staphylococcus caeli]SCS49556.1 putative lipoprotein [Staphylococcus caeli]SCS93788.1 putative lipoprotein [Staphylococcus caeli]